MNAAARLLESVRDFGWPVLAYAVFAPVATFVLPTGRTREEQVDRLFLVGIIIAVIEVLFFLGTESSDAFQVAYLNPAWGTLVLLLFLAGVAALLWWWLLRARKNRVVISIKTNPQIAHGTRELGKGYYVVLVGLWVIGAIAATVWLFKISTS